jgi:uroporphyrinogen-III synthase
MPLLTWNCSILPKFPYTLLEQVVAMSSVKFKSALFLLKTQSTPRDTYQDFFETFQDSRFTPIFVPVLQHEVQTDALERLRVLIETKAFLKSSDCQKYGGIIFTSQRAVEAFTSVVESLSESQRRLYLTKDVPLYVVGPATAMGLRSLGLECPVLGEESGNGNALAKFILNDYNSRYPSTHVGIKPGLLFLVGEQRRDIIPKTLQAENLTAGERITVDEVVVYATAEMSSFSTDFATSLSDYATTPEQYIVVFSPTGCHAMLRILDMLDSGGKFNGKKRPRTKVGTIGPTTRDYLVNEFAYAPDFVATKPSPEGIGEALN